MAVSDSQKFEVIPKIRQLKKLNFQNEVIQSTFFTDMLEVFTILLLFQPQL